MPKILIVDDEPHIRVLIEMALEDLEDEGVEILTAENGEESLNLINDQMPELVFLDVMIPKISGFEVCSKVKSSPKTKDITVMLLTAKGQGD